jgi:hypothetical protein
MEIDSYGVAQICRNGHILTDKANTDDLQQKYCSACGEPIISQCGNCLTDIKGRPRYLSQIDPHTVISMTRSRGRRSVFIVENRIHGQSRLRRR